MPTERARGYSESLTRERGKESETPPTYCVTTTSKRCVRNAFEMRSMRSMRSTCGSSNYYDYYFGHPPAEWIKMHASTVIFVLVIARIYYTIRPAECWPTLWCRFEWMRVTNTHAYRYTQKRTCSIFSHISRVYCAVDRFFVGPVRVCLDAIV